MCLSRCQRMSLEEAECAGVAGIELTYHRRISRRSKMRTKMDTEISYHMKHFVSSQLPSQNKATGTHQYNNQEDNKHEPPPYALRPRRPRPRDERLPLRVALGRRIPRPMPIAPLLSTRNNLLPNLLQLREQRSAPRLPLLDQPHAHLEPPVPCASTRQSRQHRHTACTPEHPTRTKKEKHSLSAGKRASSAARARSSSSSSLW